MGTFYEDFEKKKNNFTIWKNEPVGFAWSHFMGW